MEAILYCEEPSPRLNYIAEYLFETLLGIRVVVTHHEAEYQSFVGLRCNYSKTTLTKEEVHIRPQSLLFEKGIKEQLITSSLVEGIPVCYSIGPGYSLPFDVFSASFFILSRYEEYLPYTADQHGRYPAKQAWAQRNNCMSYPIVWEWTKLLARALQKAFPQWEPTPPGYRFIPTYDIDIPWAYSHRGLRGWGRAGLDLFRGNWPQLQARWCTQTRQAEDPYFTFPRLAKLHQETGVKARIFWLLANPSKEDINPSYRLPAYQRLIRKVANWSSTGIHPSYYSWQEMAIIKRDKKRLEEITGQEITHSRQHFLRWQLPVTYRELLAAGIQHDHSMGFAEVVGYRAGTTEPFRWYDLEQEVCTDLWVHPFAAMDVTLKQYLQYAPEKAKERLLAMQAYCQEEKLSFCTLWHNSSFSEVHGWAGWWKAYQALY